MKGFVKPFISQKYIENVFNHKFFKLFLKMLKTFYHKQINKFKTILKILSHSQIIQKNTLKRSITRKYIKTFSFLLNYIHLLATLLEPKKN